MTDSKSIHIVRLDGIHSADPTFNIPHTFISHPNTPPDDTIIASRLQTADVAITTRVPISAAVLDACPNLKLIAVFAIGSDHIDLAAAKAHQIPVCNVPGANSEAVAEHAISFYFALRRKVIKMHELTVEGVEWVEKGSLAKDMGELPRTCREEVLGILGGGELGNRVASIGRALGMKVIIADRKGVPSSSTRQDRIEFTEVLRTATVIVLTLPLHPTTLSLISAAELSLMRPDALLINVSRGGIVVEEDLVAALKERKISGAATDVFITEPAGKENVLIRAANEEWAKGRLVLSPHLAWWARSSIEKLRRVTVENVEGWARGEVRNEVI